MLFLRYLSSHYHVSYHHFSHFCFSCFTSCNFVLFDLQSLSIFYILSPVASYIWPISLLSCTFSNFISFMLISYAPPLLQFFLLNGKNGWGLKKKVAECANKVRKTLSRWVFKSCERWTEKVNEVVMDKRRAFTQQLYIQTRSGVAYDR